MLETPKHKMSEIKKVTDALGPKFDQLSEVVSELIKDYGKIKQAMIECEMRY
jgi:hypothetical protein